MESKQLVDKHFKMLYEIRYNSNIMDQYDLIENMDETHICYENIYKSTYIKCHPNSLADKQYA